MNLLNRKKKTEPYENHAVLAAIAASIDEIDKWEASEDALGSCLMTTLKTMGYSELDALTASMFATRGIYSDFPTLYWKNHTFSNKVSVFMAVVETAKKALDEGMIDANTRRVTAEALAEEKRNRTPKKPD